LIEYHKTFFKLQRVLIEYLMTFASLKNLLKSLRILIQYTPLKLEFLHHPSQKSPNLTTTIAATTTKSIYKFSFFSCWTVHELWVCMKGTNFWFCMNQIQIWGLVFELKKKEEEKEKERTKRIGRIKVL